MSDGNAPDFPSRREGVDVTSDVFVVAQSHPVHGITGLEVFEKWKDAWENYCNAQDELEDFKTEVEIFGKDLEGGSR